MKKIIAWLSAIMIIFTTALGANAASLAADIPPTGDNSMSIIIPIVVLVVAAVVVVALIFLKKKKG